MTDQGPICDFCSSLSPRWDYGCADFIYGFVLSSSGVKEYINRGGWLACEECATRIDHQDWEQLFVRALPVTQNRSAATPIYIALNLVRDAQAGFRTHRTGTKVSFG